MPLKNGKLTHKERAFVRTYAATNDATYAATKAGYGTPSQRGSELANTPAIIAEAQRLALSDLSGKILPLAVARHMQILNDKTVTGQPLNRAIEMAYKYGLVDAGEGGSKQPHEMTAEELAHAIAALKRAAADQAKPVLELKANAPAPGVFD